MDRGDEVALSAVEAFLQHIELRIPKPGFRILLGLKVEEFLNFRESIKAAVVRC